MMKNILAFVVLLMALPVQSEAIRIGGQAKQNIQYPGYIEVQGRVNPIQKVVYRLSQGDEIVDIQVSEGEKVAKDKQLYTLANDQLFTRLVTTKDKQFEIESLPLQIENLKLASQSLAEKISVAEKLQKVVSDLDSQAQLDELKKKHGEVKLSLKLAENKLAFFNQRNEQGNNLAETLGLSVNSLESRIARLTPKAPFEGIARRVLKQGANNQQDLLLLELWDQSQFEIIASVSQNQLQYVSPGAKVEIFPDYFSDDKVIGEVVSLLPYEQGRQSRSVPLFPVVIHVVGQTEKLQVGMAVTLKILEKK